MGVYNERKRTTGTVRITHLKMYSRHIYINAVSRLQSCILSESCNDWTSAHASEIISACSSVFDKLVSILFVNVHRSMLRQYNAQIDSFVDGESVAR